MLTEPIHSDLNPVDYAVWGALQQMVYQRRQFTTINQLKQAIVTDSGANLQRLDDRAIVQWRRQLECIIHKADTLNNFDEKTARCDSCFRQ